MFLRLALVLSSAFPIGASLGAQVIPAGIADDFALPTDPASPSASLLALFPTTTFLPFDSTPTDQAIGHTFDLSGIQGSIVSARLLIRIGSTGIPGVETDGVLLAFSAGETIPCAAIAWGRTFGPTPGTPPTPGIIFDAPDPGIVGGWPTATTIALIDLDLANLPQNPSSSGCIVQPAQDLIPELNAHGSLDVLVVDETRVDSMLLILNSVFVRGDCNQDGAHDLADPVALLGALFSGAAAQECADACDANDDGAIDISDPIHLLLYAFAQGAAPPAPFPACGEDPTPDTTDCDQFRGACP